MEASPKSHRHSGSISRLSVAPAFVRLTLILVLAAPGAGPAVAQEESVRSTEAQPAVTFAQLSSELSGEGLSEERRFELTTRAADRAPTVADALAAVRTHREPLRGELRARSFALEGRILALRGDLAAAADAYAEAARSAPDAGAQAAYRLEQATLLLETGTVEAVRKIAVDVVATGRSAEVQRRAGLLIARADAAAGRLEAAWEQASRLSEAAHAPTVRPETLLFLHRVSRRLERGDSAARARRLLEELYPGSPEALMVAGSGVAELPRPSALLGFTAAAPDADAPDGAVPGADAADGTELTEKEHPEGVQVGSFRSVENARDMRRRLVDLGFGAEIVDSEDDVFHRVVIPVDRGTEPQRLLLTLKEEGVEGFLVFDE